MKQIHHSFPVQTCDLTECKVHRILDEGGVPHVYVSYPVKWKDQMEAQQPNLDGDIVRIRMYTVTEWEEVEVETIGDAMRMKAKR